MASEPPPPPGGRQRRLGSGWIAGRGNSPSQPRPDAPGPITAELGTNGQVTLRWEDRSTNETGFRVEQQILAGPNWQHEGTYTVGPGREQVQVTVVTGTHRFRVMSFNGGGLSSPSGWTAPVVVDNPEEPDPLPAVPTNVHAVDTEMGSVNVHWDDNSANENGFSIQRDPPFPYPGGLRHTGANVQMISDPVGPGTYRYRVRAFNDAGVSEFSEWATVAVADQAPDAPSNLVVLDQGNEQDVLLTWRDNSDNEDSFLIQRQTQVGGQWVNTTQRTTSANVEMYTDSPGSGTYRYRVAASNSSGQSSWTSWATVSVTDGWTQFERSTDTRVIYVSSSMGNDANNGLSEAAPKRTIAAGYALLRHGYPDWLLLRRGDTWNESLGHWKKSGRSNSEKMLVGAYGPLSEPRPLLQTGTQNGFTRTGGGGSPPTIDNLAIVSIRFRAHQRTANTGGTGLWWIDPGENILVEDCAFENYKSNITVQGYTGYVTNFRVRRCLILDAYSGDSHSQGMYFAKTNDLLIEGCIIDYNGWREGEVNATIFNHNIYIQPACANVVVRNNLIARASSHGLQLRGGGEAHENVFVANPISVLLGTGGADGGGSDPTFPVIANAHYNVILHGRDIAAPNQPRGFGMDVLYASGGDIHHNILADASMASAPRSIHLDGSQGQGNRNVSIHHNIVYNWGGSVTFRGDTTRLQDIQFSDNVVQTLTGSWPLIEHVSQSSIGEVAYARNRFYSSGAANSWMRIGNTFYGFQQWRAAVNDNGSTAEQVSFPDPGRSVASYAASVGLPATLEAYLQRVRQVRKGDWPHEFTPEALASYIRQGFGMADP